ncbi:MAG: D-tyrosyl-tRNA(Tyr) deacylase, partial [Deferribacterales bacterium]|nr:D-tyrosyl-tRNA(Tyr) deacylase [Deferribacterales bacterium]
RIFEDENGKMSRSLIDIDGSVLVVSQFTLAGNASKGRRPDFTGAEAPERANEFYIKFIDELKSILGDKKVASGIFGANMEVSLVNDGPVTILVEKRQ